MLRHTSARSTGVTRSLRVEHEFRRDRLESRGAGTARRCRPRGRVKGTCCRCRRARRRAGGRAVRMAWLTIEPASPARSTSSVTPCCLEPSMTPRQVARTNRVSSTSACVSCGGSAGDAAATRSPASSSQRGALQRSPLRRGCASDRMHFISVRFVQALVLGVHEGVRACARPAGGRVRVVTRALRAQEFVRKTARGPSAGARHRAGSAGHSVLTPSTAASSGKSDT